VIENLKTRLNQLQFYPGCFGPFVNPFYLARRGLYHGIADMASGLSGRFLDVGCGQKPYKALFHSEEYIGLELDTLENRSLNFADYYYDGGRFPFDDRFFDVILCNQVLEHVFEPQNFLVEIRRVLKPGGKILLTVPFAWDEHEQPKDYARYSSFGLKYLVEAAGFNVLAQRKINSDVCALSQLVNAYLYKVLRTRHPWVNLLICAGFMAPITLIGLLLSKVLPANPDFYLDQLVLAERSAHD
jgi:SAM-dependent methyltransferase